LGDDAVEPLAYVPYVWSDQFDLRMTMAGEIREGDDMHVCRGSLEEGRCLVLFGREGRLTGAVGFRRSRRLNASLKMIAEDTSWEKAIASHS
jgi:3-phenylpropionate/trans-cinnamate dioxygenase ferredoxin reductase subunit